VRLKASNTTQSLLLQFRQAFVQLRGKVATIRLRRQSRSRTGWWLLLGRNGWYHGNELVCNFSRRMGVWLYRCVNDENVPGHLTDVTNLVRRTQRTDYGQNWLVVKHRKKALCPNAVY
jgi:hypothetical protein